MYNLRNKLYYITKVDPRLQVLFFQKDEQNVFVPQFERNHETVSFDPRPLFSDDYSTPLQSIRVKEDKTLRNDFLVNNIVRIENEYSNLYGAESEDGSVTVCMYTLSDLILSTNRLQVEIENLNVIDTIHYNLLVPYTFTTQEQLKAFAYGVPYGEEQGEFFDNEDLPRILRQEFHFLKESSYMRQSFSAQLGYIFVHHPARVNAGGEAEADIDLRDLFDRIDINQAETINHIVLFFEVENNMYQLHKTRKGVPSVVLSDEKIMYDIKALNIVINEEYVIYIYPDASVSVKKYAQDTKDVVDVDQLVKKIAQHRQQYEREFNMIDGLLRAYDIKLPVTGGTLELQKTQITFYSSFKATTQKETQVMIPFRSMDLVKDLTSQVPDLFLIQRVSNDGIRVKFSRIQGRFQCEIMSVQGSFFKLVISMLGHIFAYSEFLREGKRTKTRNDISQGIMEYDPDLFRHVKGPEHTYPRTCASHRQPKLITQEEYDGLFGNEKTKQMVGVMKHTSEKTPYYLSCAHHSETPYFYQITGKQADNRCFPCCKKKFPSEVTKHKNKICETTGVFLQTRKEKHGRYVIKNYHQIKPNRLALLPQTLQFIIGEQAYLLGVEQDIQGHQVGLFYSCVEISGLDVFDFLRRSESYYMMRKSTTVAENRTFMSSVMNFFRSISSTATTSHNNNVDIYTNDLVYIMPYVLGIDLLILSVEGDITTLGLSLVNKGIILKSDMGYNPILRVSPEKFYASIDLEHEIQMQREKTPKYFPIGTLKLNKSNFTKIYSHDFMYDYFIKERGYYIVTIYFNADDNCFGMLLRHEDNNSNIYVPFEIEPRSHLQKQYESSVPISFNQSPFDASKVTLDNHTLSVLSTTLSELTTGTGGLVTKIIQRDDQVIGFVQFDLVFYCQPVHLSMLQIPRDENTVSVNISYDLYTMNHLLMHMRAHEREGKSYQQINDPEQQKTLRQGLLEQNEYSAIKFNAIDQMRAKGITNEKLIELEQGEIEKLIMDSLEFEQKDQYDLQRYDNIIVSCMANQKQAYCHGKKLIVRNLNTLKKYVSILAYELHRAPVSTMASSKRGSVADQLEFNPQRGHVVFKEIVA